MKLRVTLTVLSVMLSATAQASGTKECLQAFNPPKPGFFARLMGRAETVPTTPNQKREQMINATARVSMLGTTNNGELTEGLLPRGSAMITSSGVLKETGITSIIHAATGAMTKQGGHYEPTLESVKLSVKNAIALAERFGHNRIAIPLIGGGIFIQRLGVQPAELAAEIISTAREARTIIEIRFVAFGDADVQTFREGWALVERADYKGLDGMEIKQGSITDFPVHGSSVIVNAANTEVVFGGGLSGAIAKATQNAEAINAEAASVLSKLNPR